MQTSRREGARARMYHDLVFESAECVFGDKGFERATIKDAVLRNHRLEVRVAI